MTGKNYFWKKLSVYLTGDVTTKSSVLSHLCKVLRETNIFEIISLKNYGKKKRFFWIKLTS